LAQIGGNFNAGLGSFFKQSSPSRLWAEGSHMAFFF